MNRDNPEHTNVQGCRILHQFINFTTAPRFPGSPGLAYGFLDHTTYVFHCAFMDGKTIVMLTNIAMFGDIQQFPSDNESRRTYIPESDNSDGMVPVTLPGLAIAE